MARNGSGRARRAAGARRVASDRRDALRPGTSTPDQPGDNEPQALVVTHWFDPGLEGEPYAAVVRFTGRRAGVQGTPGPSDRFEHEERIERVVPGTGPVSVSAWIHGVRPGEWSVTAELVDTRAPTGLRGGTERARSIQPARWSWRRWSVTSEAAGTLPTRWAVLAPLARTPAVVPGSLPALATLGTFVALTVQAAILTHEGVDVGRALLVSIVALATGLLAAKLWYVALHPGERILQSGWAVDGFLVVAPLVGTTGLLAANLPIGAFLDAATPGIFLAVALGRIGCFLTGCCAGRPSSARWAIWSSDRSIGARRIPTQLLESVTGLVLAAATLPLALIHVPFHGLAFVGAFGIYAAVRQVLLRLRAEQRRSRRSLPLTAAAIAVALLVIMGALVAYPKHPPIMAIAVPAPVARGVAR